jgi:hypothetical protein
MDCEDAGVGSMMRFQQAMQQDLRSGLHKFHGQHIQIMEDGTDLIV